LIRFFSLLKRKPDTVV